MRTAIVAICLAACVLAVSAAHHPAHGKKSSLEHFTDAVTRATNVSTLKDAAALTGRYFGTCIASMHLGEQDYVNAVLRDFSSGTPENEMKWDATEPSNNTWSFSGADQVFNFTKTHDLQIRGHTLVWYSQLPNWVNAIKDRPTLQQAMYNHMEVMMARYKGQIFAWDVVNEAFVDDGNMRDSTWTHVFGNSTLFIELAFTHARAQDPDAILCYNDYSTDGINPKSTGVYNMVKDFKQRGVPIDCVGFQSHLNEHPTADYQANLERFAALGVDVMITELDIQNATSGGADKQAEAYGAVINACLNVPRCLGVTVWGVTDKYSWKSSTTPLLLDGNYKEKPAYTAVLDAFEAAAPTTATPVPHCAVTLTDAGSSPHQLSYHVHSQHAAIVSVKLRGRAFARVSAVNAHSSRTSASFALKIHAPHAPFVLDVTLADGSHHAVRVTEFHRGSTFTC